MEIKAKYLLIWAVLLIIGVAMIVGPVVAGNWESPKKPKIYDKGDKIDKPDKDKKDINDDPIKIKSHPVLKSPTASSITSTTWVKPINK